MLKTGVILAERYRLDDPIAAGGVGQVWRGTDLVLRRRVALKLLRPEYAEHPETLERFRAEARHAGSLTHPCIAQVHDYGDGGPSQPPFLVMELVDGPSLADVLAAEPVNAAYALDVISKAAAGLAAAHRTGMVHRDLKPGNILLGPDGQVKISDFGIAHAAGSARLTDPGLVMGTTQYLAPERIGGTPATPASDLYSMGIVLHECLTGMPPFEGTPAEVMAGHLYLPLPAPPAGTPAEVEELISRLTCKDPADRLSDAGDLATIARRLASAIETGRISPPRQRQAPSISPVTGIPADPSGDPRLLRDFPSQGFPSQGFPSQSGPASAPVSGPASGPAPVTGPPSSGFALDTESLSSWPGTGVSSWPGAGMSSWPGAAVPDGAVPDGAVSDGAMSDGAASEVVMRSGPQSSGGDVSGGGSYGAASSGAASSGTRTTRVLPDGSPEQTSPRRSDSGPSPARGRAARVLTGHGAAARRRRAIASGALLLAAAGVAGWLVIGGHGNGDGTRTGQPASLGIVQPSVGNTSAGPSPRASSAPATGIAPPGQSTEKTRPAKAHATATGSPTRASSGPTAPAGRPSSPASSPSVPASPSAAPSTASASASPSASAPCNSLLSCIGL